jgi:hypothetical protein
MAAAVTLDDLIRFVDEMLSPAEAPVRVVRRRP